MTDYNSVLTISAGVPEVSDRGAGWRTYGGAKDVAGAYFRGFRPGKPWPTCRARVGEGVRTANCAGVGFSAIWAGGFLLVEAAGGFKTVASLKKSWVLKLPRPQKERCWETLRP